MFHNLIMFYAQKFEKEFAIYFQNALKLKSQLVIYARKTFHYFDLDCILKLKISCELLYFRRYIINRKVLNNSKVTLIKIDMHF